MHDENFKSFLKDEKIEKYGYDIKNVSMLVVGMD